MGITYERTMKINYSTRMIDLDFRKLVAELSTKGIYVCGKYDDYTENDYGFTERTTSTTKYIISTADEIEMLSVGYRGDAAAIVEGLGHLIEGLEYKQVIKETTKKVWAEPDGSYIVVTGENKDGKNLNIDCFGNNSLEYSNGAIMQINLQNGYGGLRLQFTITWEVDTVQRKDKIEEAMVQMVMADMGKIQAIVEGRMKLKKFGVNVEDVDISCHFDAKTESRSECTPDIIKQVRDARKGLE
tara:strand:+ start:2774 stop:3502 length:729 start_codon:yes stop_codon:yes gene_type:complete